MGSITKIGVVEDNKDPDKRGRCKVRINELHSKDLKVDNLPWASPWKDLNGNQFILPDIGKVVLVVLDGNSSNPEYISAESYNVNLENKLKQLSDADYISMRSLLFDEKNQIYSNDSEGLKIDYKFNNINITKDSISLNLKDNFSNIHIGTNKKEQRVILGDSFTEWFTKFLRILSTGGFLGNLQTPVLPSSPLITHIQEYDAKLIPNFLSKHVYVVDNESVKVQERTPEVTIPQKGDVWKSTVIENTVTKTEEKTVDYTPIKGPSTQTLTPPVAEQTTTKPKNETVPPTVENHPDVDVLLEIIKMKNYTLYQRPYELNIISVRKQCLAVGDKFSNSLSDKLYILYKDDNESWQVENYRMSTVPGTEFTITDEWLKGLKLDSTSYNYWKTKLNQKVTVKEFKKGAKTEPPKEEIKKGDESWKKRIFNQDDNTESKFKDLNKLVKLKKQDLKEINSDLDDEDFEKVSKKGLRYFYDNEEEEYAVSTSIENDKATAINSSISKNMKLIEKSKYYVDTISYGKKMEDGKFKSISISLVFSETAVTIPEDINGKIYWEDVINDGFTTGEKPPSNKTKVYLSDYNKISNNKSEGETDLSNYVRDKRVEYSDSTKGIPIYKEIGGGRFKFRWVSFDEDTNNKINYSGSMNDISGGMENNTGLA